MKMVNEDIRDFQYKKLNELKYVAVILNKTSK